MNTTFKTQIASIGYLRLGLIGLAIVSMIIPIIAWTVTLVAGELSEGSMLSLSARLIAPVLAPTIIVVVLLDYIMAKVRAIDDQTSQGDMYRIISRFDALLILVMLIFWVPFFAFLIS